MKSFIIYTLVATFVLLSCSKTKEKDDFLAITKCKDFTVNTQKVNVCFDNVISDSRCPTGGICIWEGCGVVALKITIGAELHTIQLSTLQRGVLQFPSNDTTINNVKIELQDLTPYPCVNCSTHPTTKDYKVKLKVTEM